MIFKNSTFYNFVDYIKRTEKKIICYGAGMLPLYTEPLFRNYGLANNVVLFIDGDAQKWGHQVCYAGRDIWVETPEYLAGMDAAKHVVLITAEKYKEIEQMLVKLELPKNWECYSYPCLNLTYFKGIKVGHAVSDVPARIPKVIHYTWFGGEEKRMLQRRCIESWHRFCPDFEIREWNERNYDVHKNQYVAEAYDCKKWAYVSDYARMDVLYQCGGIYLDTDVELFQGLNPLLGTEAFLCFGEWPVPNSGAGTGCVKGNKLMKELMETREDVPFIQNDGEGDTRTNSNYEMKVMMNHGFRMDFTFQLMDGIALYPPDVIAPASLIGENAFVTEQTLGIHHCLNTWRD